MNAKQKKEKKIMEKPKQKSNAKAVSISWNLNKLIMRQKK